MHYLCYFSLTNQTIWVLLYVIKYTFISLKILKQNCLPFYRCIICIFHFKLYMNQFLFTPGLMWLLEATLDFWKSGTLKRSRSLAHIYQNKMYVIYSFCLGQKIKKNFILFSHQLGGKERVLNFKLNGLGLSFQWLMTT